MVKCVEVGRMTLADLTQNESTRLAEFPVARESIFMAHAGVCILPRRATKAMQDYLEMCSLQHQESGHVWSHLNEARVVAGKLIGAKASEIALLGPTSVGLSLVANGLPWQAGDEIVCYHDDYPANVYPWMDLQRRGVVLRFVKTDLPGHVTPEAVERALTPKTRLVALASCHFFTGYRIDVDAIGKMLRSRGIWFCLDAIQTVGAFETKVDHVDFLSADSHKWMLGPMAAGIVYVREALHDVLRPSLIGAWNVKSPNFIAQDQVEFEGGGRRYEPGVLNAVGIYGMKAALEMLLEIGIDNVSARLLTLKAHLIPRLEALGFSVLPPLGGANASGITTATREGGASLQQIFDHLAAHKVVISLRHNRAGVPHLRFSPHFYNTEAEVERVCELIGEC
jgi:cysteine desulfurase / selenocysteine lyase